MAFTVLHQLANDGDFLLRASACAASEGWTDDPENWAQLHRWELAATPGWLPKYEGAIQNGRKNPGWDRDVITDEDLIYRIQPLVRAELEARANEAGTEYIQPEPIIAPSEPVAE